MIVRGYSMDLYCENAHELRGTGYGGDIHDYNEFPKTYAGETRAECVREARADGWKINIKAGTCICPKCTEQRKR